VRELVVAELASQIGLEVVERAVRPEELRAAEEGFLTNVLLGIVPLTEVDCLPIGTGEPGHICAELGAGLEQSMARPSR
jgi:branched-subunit amino acid aminotransferase/4-amino-4-deoxychorismate lyase